MDSLSSLNPQQRTAAEHVNGPLLILAGAGSGKTRVIVQRIAHLLAEGHARPEELLAVTFTNKAAEEMRSRVQSLVGDDCSALWVSTFHALCARLLRREAPAIGFTRDFVIYDSADQLALMKQVLRELHVDDGLLQPRAALSRISNAKNTMEARSSLAESAAWSLRGEELVKIYDRYTAALREANALDFDDLLLKTVELFDTSDAVRTRYSSRFRFVMVDEYQDTNRPQYLLIQHLTARHRNLCVVGDPDQSIYKWRGADVRNILDFERDYPDAAVVQLEQNYRSTQMILDAATAVIRQNRHRTPKRLWTDRKGGARIVHFRGADELEEAAFITRTTRSVVAEGGDAVAAVLYRTNAQSRVIEDALMREGVPYRIVGGVRFYERKEVRDALAYLKLILNPLDDVSLRRIINVPARGVGKGVMDQLERLPVEHDSHDTPLLADALADEPPATSLWAKVGRAVDGRLLTTRATAALRAFRELIESLGEMAKRESLSVAISRVLDQSGYITDLREERSEEAQGRLDNLMELVSAAREFEMREPEPSLAGFVDRLSLLSDVDEEAGSRDARIWLMTMHAAKGLEFPLVVISGLEEGLFPHSRANGDDAELDEERRLCYVAMTRARSRLVLTGAARRRVFGEYQRTEPSRFLDEVPSELVDRIESPTLSGYQRADSGSGSRKGRYRSEPEHVPFSYEDEDQSVTPVRIGARVRHPTFGVGTVLSVEPLTDDLKLVVRFGVGAKTLRAKYAKLEPA